MIAKILIYVERRVGRLDIMSEWKHVAKLGKKIVLS